MSTDITVDSNRQYCLIDQLVSSKALTLVFLSTGIRLRGTITTGDQYTLVLKSGANRQFIYKHSIATIQR